MTLSINWKKVTGIVTITGIIGFTGYCIYLGRKQRLEEENAISVEEAQAITDDLRKNNIVEFPKELVKTDEEWEEEFEELHKIIAKSVEEVEEENAKEDLEELERELEEEQLAEGLIFEPEALLHEDEGDGKLRYDPNTTEALVQFQRMELADWAPNDEIYTTLDQLFEVTFDPEVDGDVTLLNKLQDYRAEFFGPASFWVTKVSFTDLILHYARLADYNVGRGVKYWVAHFIEAGDLNVFDHSDTTIEYFLGLMECHEFKIRKEDGHSYSIFGLNDEEYENAVEVAARNIDSSLTFEIEFQEFLKGVMRREA